MLFRTTGTLLGVLAFALSVAAQSTPPSSGITRTVIAAAKLLTVTEVPIYFRAVSVTLPPEGKTALSVSSGILYQITGSTEITFDKQPRLLAPGEGSFIPAGRTAALKATGEAPSALLHFVLGPATDLGQSAYTAPATARELYRTLAPIPGLKPGTYDLNLTRITFPPQMPSNQPHHGAALYYIVKGIGTITVGGKTEMKGPESLVYEPFDLVHQGEILAVSRSPSWLSTSALMASPLCFPAHLQTRRSRKRQTALDVRRAVVRS